MDIIIHARVRQKKGSLAGAGNQWDLRSIFRSRSFAGSHVYCFPHRIKLTYIHDETGEHQAFDYPESQLLIVATCSFLITYFINRFNRTPEERNCVPEIHGIKSGGAVAFSTIAYSYAIKYMNFPVVMMVRSCSILSVVLVGVLFSGVKDTTLKLGKRKILIAAVATAGMIVFKVFDPNSANITYTA